MNDNASGSFPFESPDEENRPLREENARLRRMLSVHGIAIPPLPPANPPPAKTVGTVQLESKEERARKRIALFRGLFRGREDVYARRWESADGRSGYVPAALKDWKVINKSRPADRKRVDQKTRKLFPLTDAVVEDQVEKPLGFTRCSRTKPAGSLLWTSIIRPGSMTPSHSLKLAGC
jgi:hypothetical protein